MRFGWSKIVRESPRGSLKRQYGSPVNEARLGNTCDKQKRDEWICVLPFDVAVTYL